MLHKSQSLNMMKDGLAQPVSHVKNPTINTSNIIVNSNNSTGQQVTSIAARMLARKNQMNNSAESSSINDYKQGNLSHRGGEGSSRNIKVHN